MANNTQKLSSEKSEICLGIVGCGYIAEIAHLPASLKTQGCKVVSLIDLDLNRAQHLAQQFNIPHASNDITSLRGRIDGVVISTPPGSHFKLAMDMLNSGLHVLVEKPFVPTVFECDELIQLARDNQRILAAAMARRFYPSDRYVKQLLAAGILGKVKSFEIENGYDYRWPSVSNFILSKESAGGGILMGLGSHILDTLIWWLGDVKEIKLESDAYGGIESEAKLLLVMESGTSGSVEFSRSRELTNQICLNCEKGIITIPLNNNEVNITLNGDLTLSGSINIGAANLSAAEPFDPFSIYVDQLEDFARAIKTGTSPAVNAEAIRKSISVIESAYQVAESMRKPWQRPILMPSIQQSILSVY